MSSDQTVTHWIRALKEGDEQGARELWQRYFNQLVRVARARLGSAPRRAADEEDVALSVFDSLCKGAAQGHFPELNDREDLWQLLLTITHQKSVDHIRRETRQKRGGGQVQGESAFLRTDSSADDAGLQELAGSEPTPEFLAQLAEEHQRLLGMLRDDTLRHIAQWKMDGFTNEEIAGKLGVATRSVERKVRLIRDQWGAEVTP
jgi:DNA-directed RNA polymerase specialized sigma24 family protein